MIWEIRSALLALQSNLVDLAVREDGGGQYKSAYMTPVATHSKSAASFLLAIYLSLPRLYPTLRRFLFVGALHACAERASPICICLG